MRKPILALVIAATALLAGKTSGDAAQPPEEIVLVFSGTAGTAFSADCTFRTVEGDVPFRIETGIPFRKSFQGFGLKCEIVKQTGHGTLSVEARKGSGSVSKTTTSGTKGRAIISLQ